MRRMRNVRLFPVTADKSTEVHVNPSYFQVQW